MDCDAGGPMESLHRIADDRDIERLQYRYCRAVDRRDLEGLGALFIDDARFETIIGSHHGREAIVESFRALSAQVTRKHYITNVDIVMHDDGQSASVTSMLLAMTSKDGDVRIAGGTYDDEVVLVDGQWRFAVKRADMDIPFTSVNQLLRGA